jgi:hypothetical protein
VRAHPAAKERAQAKAIEMQSSKMPASHRARDSSTYNTYLFFCLLGSY